MRGFGILACAVAMLPATAAAQSNSAAPQTNPGINFNLPTSPRATPQSAPTSGPIVAPFNRPIPTQTPIRVPLSVLTPTPSATTAPKPGNTPVATPTRRAPTAAPTSQPAPTPAPTTSASPTPEASATVAPPVASETPEATATPAPVAPEPAPRGWSSGTIVAIGVAVLALLAAGWFLFGRRHRAAEEFVEPLPEPVAPAAPAEPTPSGHITIPARRRAAEEKAPRLEITLIPRRAGTNLTSAAVDYRVLVRNAGTVPARDIRMAMYMLSASARQAQDLQAVFATPVDQPVVPPFELAPGGEIDLSGIAQLARERVNVMTIDGKPWFVPVLAMKAEYRWGENVGAPGVATAAHMIGIDRGEGAKMAPFRLDGSPRMHPEVAERKVA